MTPVRQALFCGVSGSLQLSSSALRTRITLVYSRFSGPWECSGKTTRLPPMQTGFDSRWDSPIFSHVVIVPDDAAGNLPLAPLFHSGAALNSLRFTVVGSQDLAYPEKRLFRFRASKDAATHSQKAGRRPGSQLHVATEEYSTHVACRHVPRSLATDEHERATKRAFSPPWRTGSKSRPDHPLMFVCGHRAGRCRWSAGFFGVPSFVPFFHSGAAPYSPQSPSSALKTSLLRAATLTSRIRRGLLAEFLRLGVFRSLAWRRGGRALWWEGVVEGGSGWWFRDRAMSARSAGPEDYAAHSFRSLASSCFPEEFLALASRSAKSALPIYASDASCKRSLLNPMEETTWCEYEKHLHHHASKLDPRSNLRLTQKTVAPFEFRAGLEIEINFISNRRNWRFEISILDQLPSSTNIDESEIENYEISLVRHFYIGTKIKLDPGSELGSFDLGSEKMLVQPAPELRDGENGIPPRKPAGGQRHRQARFPLARIRESTGRGLNWASILTAQPPWPLCATEGGLRSGQSNRSWLRVRLPATVPEQPAEFHCGNRMANACCELANAVQRTNRLLSAVMRSRPSQLGCHYHKFAFPLLEKFDEQGCPSGAVGHVPHSEEMKAVARLSADTNRASRRRLNIWTALNSDVFRADVDDLGEFGAAPERKVGGKREIREKTRRTNSIVRHDSHMRKSGVTRPRIETGSPWFEASRLTA
ncbi:hypothetical protein PR048_014977 [Dryococelus australis]|uniref:Uncharacterized protein n=1 Tax=Dryococelus australis TaxID=614101 RepID=A0ABQ9HFQ1_9NEOP|nr:hypothetical protein PR048_014977 [Dryococelus australis]